MDVIGQEARRLRMASLLLAAHPDPNVSAPDSVGGVVTWFGAMQAQDLASGMWSLGVRLPGWTVTDVHQALERREALRTWPMRGTVHLVPSRDAHWMLDLMGGRALAGAAARRAYLGLADATAQRAVDVLGAALAGGGRLTRAQCVATLQAAGVPVTGQLGYHLLWYASQRGVTCIAPDVGGQQTFALLDEWVPDPVRLDREQALATIAVRYLRSHGPTTRQDLAGWTGLPMADVRQGIAAAGDALARVDVDGREMYADPALLDAAAAAPDALAPDGVLALPGFDEFVLGYKDRSLILADEHKDAVVPGGNGMFRPTLARDGRVIGTWTRAVARGRIVVSVQPLVPLRAADRRRVEAAFGPYAHYTERPLDVRWP